MRISKLYDYYEVTEEGKIYRVARTVMRKDGQFRRIRRRELSCTNDGYGYLHIRLFDSSGKRVCDKLHRIVATAFISNPDNKRTVNHLDGNKFNNSASNLEWATDTENANHAYSNGLKKCKKFLANGKVYNCMGDLSKEIELPSKCSFYRAIKKHGKCIYKGVIIKEHFGH